MMDRTAQQNDWYFTSEAQTEAISRLLYVVDNGEVFSLLEGAWGTGKSTVFKQTATELARSGRRVVRQSVAALDCRATLWQICGALSIFSPADADVSQLMMQVRDELLSRAHCCHDTAILLDDADFAQKDISTVLHLLTSIAESSEGRLSIIAAAEQPIAFSLQKRTSLNIRLQPLAESEAIEFAVRRLAHLNCPVQQVSDTGWRAIADLGHGLPAHLLQICRIVQVVSSMQSGLIDAAMVHGASHELLPQAA
jgi:type II secretory pathway predicted ATPase ExeA